MRTFAMLLLGTVVGWAASGVDWSREAVAQEDEAPSFAPQNPDNGGISNPGPELKQKIAEWTKGAADYSQINRYQISAADNGCYRVDTATGRMWHVAFGVKPRMIAGEVETAESQD